jgi:hypothetical protein
MITYYYHDFPNTLISSKQLDLNAQQYYVNISTNTINMYLEKIIDNSTSGQGIKL